jgi:hypothetical protein
MTVDLETQLEDFRLSGMLKRGLLIPILRSNLQSELKKTLFLRVGVPPRV